MRAARQAWLDRLRRRFGALALAGYVVVAFLYFGLPVADHPGRDVVGSNTDPNIFIWSFAWWPHAILHGLNPIYTHVIWAPSGYNLAWVTSVPGLALAFAPLTLIAGPVVAYNTAAILMPALAAWTAFLLCRYLSHSLWPSLAGGYLFGFSSYMLGHEEGHLHLTAVFLVPLVALTLVRCLDGSLSPRRTAVRLGLLLVAQLSISTEVFGTLTIAIAVSLVLAVGFIPTVRGRIRSLVPPLVSGYVIGAALGSPILYYVLAGFIPGSFGPTGSFVSDALNLVVPTQTAAVGGSAAHGLAANFSGANDLERSAYLGVPLLAIVALFGLRRLNGPGQRFLLLSFAVAVVASFGSWAHVAGHRVIPLPWWLVAHLPIFNNTYPGRLMLYAWLAATVMVALWAASRQAPRWLRVALPLLAVASLLPHLDRNLWVQAPGVPAFFTERLYKTCLDPGENVLAIPYGFRGDSVLWQAISDFEFRLAGGQIGVHIPRSFAEGYAETHRVDNLLAGGVPPEEAGTVKDLAVAKGATTILVDPRDPWPWSSVLSYLGTPVSVGGVLLYRVGEHAAPRSNCG